MILAPLGKGARVPCTPCTPACRAPVHMFQNCQRNQISFVYLPPNSTHLSQPLDVAYYAPLKKKWRQILQNYKLKNPRESSVSKTSFPHLLRTLVDELKTKDKQTITSAFRATGIIPLDPSQVLKRLPKQRADSNLQNEVSQTLTQFLQEIRSPPEKVSKPRKKMLRIEPGKSVSYEDMRNISGDLAAPSTSGLSKSTRENSPEIDPENDGDSYLTITEDETLKTNINPEIGDYVIVPFATKKTLVHFVALVIEKPFAEVKVKFLRKKKDGSFVFPQADDISVLDVVDIIKILDKPVISPRGFHHFEHNFSEYNNMR